MLIVLSSLDHLDWYLAPSTTLTEETHHNFPDSGQYKMWYVLSEHLTLNPCYENCAYCISSKKFQRSQTAMGQVAPGAHRDQNSPKHKQTESAHSAPQDPNVGCRPAKTVSHAYSHSRERPGLKADNLKDQVRASPKRETQTPNPGILLLWSGIFRKRTT